MNHRRRFSLGAVCALALAWGCSQEPGKNAQPSQAASPAPLASATRQAATQHEYDLGGPCLEKDPGRRMPMAWILKEDEYRSAGNWDAIIEARRDLVRDDCDIPYRWGELSSILAESGRHSDAVKVANDLKRRGVSVPHGFLAKASPTFLASSEFRESPLGREYVARDKEIQEIVRQAEIKLAAMPAKDLPPNVYESKGACPFECCTYREWKTERPVRLQRSIIDPTFIVDIPAGADVVGVTGEVHVEPEPHVAIEDVGPVLKKGDIVFFLDNEGEGYVSYWYKGKIKPELGLEEGLTFYVEDACPLGTPCILKKLRPGKKFHTEWWVRIQTADRKEGWTLNTGQFLNVDQCG